jgi:hypothetical protein
MSGIRRQGSLWCLWTDTLSQSSPSLFRQTAGIFSRPLMTKPSAFILSISSQRIPIHYRPSYPRACHRQLSMTTKHLFSPWPRCHRVSGRVRLIDCHYRYRDVLGGPQTGGNFGWKHKGIILLDSTAACI